MIQENDIEFIKSILPTHYNVEPSNYPDAINCKSVVGIMQDGDADDEEHWFFIKSAIQNHYGERFAEIYHNTCMHHKDFTIYLKSI